jgi:riboflavin biosynthesis pyrimidine reductase
VTRLVPWDVLLDRSRGAEMPLRGTLAHLYGTLRMPSRRSRPYVVANFASTLDGVVSLQQSGTSSGEEITGFEPHDRLLMGILRACADAVVVGAGTFRAVPRHIWTAAHVDPSRKRAFEETRRRLGKAAAPLNVVVTSSGRLDLRLPLFTSGEVPVLIVTTRAGARRFRPAKLPPAVRVATVRGSGRIPARAVLDAIDESTTHPLVLVEGGPHLLGDFLAEKRLDELFLTLVPQIAGREDPLARPGLVAGRLFAPGHPRWGTLVGVRQAESLLFLRIAFGTESRSATSRRS